MTQWDKLWVEERQKAVWIAEDGRRTPPEEGEKGAATIRALKQPVMASLG